METSLAFLCTKMGKFCVQLMWCKAGFSVYFATQRQITAAYHFFLSCIENQLQNSSVTIALQENDLPNRL